jgi:hypothetical protein
MSLKEIIANFEHPVAMAFGNPLLDVILSNDKNNLVSKYNLSFDAQIELKEKEINQLFTELTDE